MEVVEINIDVVCIGCKSSLETVDYNARKGEIATKPCETCIDRAIESNRDKWESEREDR